MRTILVAVIATLLFVPASPVNAQSSLADFQLIGGVTAISEKPHTTGGGLLRLQVRGFGVVGLGALGTGSDYQSRLLGAALSRRVIGFGKANLWAFGGLGQYREVGWTKIERNAAGILYGGIASIDVEPLILSITVTELRGSFEGDEMTDAFDFRVPRIYLGIGFTDLLGSYEPPEDER